MTADTTPESLEYTPTTEDIRDHWACRYGEFGGNDTQDPEQEAQFDRWLAAHDAEVARKAAEKAWAEGWNVGWDGRMLYDFGIDTARANPRNPYRAEQIGEK